MLNGKIRTKEGQSLHKQFKATAVKSKALRSVLIQDVAEALEIHPFMLALWRKRPSFERFAYAANTALMMAGGLLLLMQLHGYLHYADPDSFRFPADEHKHIHQDMDIEKTTDPSRNTL